MKGTQFAQFSAKVLQRGAAAILPQNLSDHWLDALLEEADLFAPGEWDPEESDRVHECCAGLLAPCSWHSWHSVATQTSWKWPSARS